jgi:hypothetical protein
MSSDTRVASALAAVAPWRVAYRAAAITSLERIRTVLTTAQGADRARQQLGALGAAHIDAARFAELSHSQTMDAGARGVVSRAGDMLRALVDAPESDFVVQVPDGESLREAIGGVLARWGCVFGATGAAELARAGRFDSAQHESLLAPWPFELWTRLQRLAAPPVVAVVNGQSLRANELAGFLDGTTHIVLVVNGECPPAALVRLITPATLVLQTLDDTGLDRFMAHAGPAIAAVVPDSAATFIHDPANGAELWQRLAVWRRPSALPRRTASGLSPAQQQQEMLQLEALAKQPSLPLAVVDTLAPAAAWDGSATDRLASWLLAQAADTRPA